MKDHTLSRRDGAQGIIDQIFSSTNLPDPMTRLHKHLRRQQKFKKNLLAWSWLRFYF